MREILFKAKRLDNGEWVEGFYAFMKPYHYIMPEDSYDAWYEINPETICQFTGLYDKNGNKIWENDVVNIDSYSYMEPEDRCYGVVRYSNAKSAFCLVVVMRGYLCMNVQEVIQQSMRILDQFSTILI